MSKNPLKKHFFCAFCKSPLQCEAVQCSQCEVKKNNHFITICPIAQLQSLYKRKGFKEKLNYRFTRQDPPSTIYSDIYDGSLYKSLSVEGQILSDSHAISFTWYSDGVQIFKSSKFSIWPFYLTINELPYNERFEMENLLLIGLWFGVEKPQTNLFLSPLQETFEDLYKGVNFYVYNCDIPINVRGIIMCGTADLPAKAIFLNFNQFNGKFGCPVCKEEGLLLERRRVYPYNENLVMRTDSKTIEQAIVAFNNSTKVCGVKGPSILKNIVYKYVTSTSVDIMHCCFLGIEKRMLSLWFDAQYSNENFSIRNAITLVDKKKFVILKPQCSHSERLVLHL